MIVLCGIAIVSFFICAVFAQNHEILAFFHRRNMRYLNLIRFRPVAFQKLRAIFSEMM